MSVRRSMAGFMGPRDIFRNPEAIFRLFEGPGQMLQKVGAGKPPNLAERHSSPFELVLSREGDDFAVMGMHFKLGLYEHQSAGALQGLISLLASSFPSHSMQTADPTSALSALRACGVAIRTPPRLVNCASTLSLSALSQAANPEIKAGGDGSNIRKITITAYEPAYGIIGDPAKMDPRTRQSADHSMAYIVSTKLRKALQGSPADWWCDSLFRRDSGQDHLSALATACSLPPTANGRVLVVAAGRAAALRCSISTDVFLS